MVNTAAGAHSRSGSRSSYPQESPRQVQLLYTEPCPFACGCAARLTLLQRSHSADSTTDRRSSSQLFPGAARIPRVVALGMSSPVALVCRTRIRLQIVIYFCRYTGSCRKRRRDVNAILGQNPFPKNSVKNYMSYKDRRCCRGNDQTLLAQEKD